MATGRIPTTANSPLTAKGDLFTFSTGSAKLAVGNNGETLVADSSTATGLRWQGDYAAGKNKIINGDFGVWQRGTSFASITSNSYFADRFAATFTAGGGTNTFSRQTFTPGAAPVAGYEGSYFARLAVTSGGASTTVGMYQKIEDVRTLAGQTATISFWAKADSARTLSIFTVQDFGSGGSSSVVTSTNTALTTSWARYSYTVSLASISGKTIGTNSFLYIAIELGAGQASGSVTLDTWGWQVEASNTATAFQTATGTIQGELAACQRYYIRFGGSSLYETLATGIGQNTLTSVIANVFLPVQMRVAPTSLEYSTVIVYDGTSLLSSPTGITFDNSSIKVAKIVITGLTSIVAYRPNWLLTNNSTSGYLGFSAEL